MIKTHAILNMSCRTTDVQREILCQITLHQIYSNELELVIIFLLVGSEELKNQLNRG